MLLHAILLQAAVAGPDLPRSAAAAAPSCKDAPAGTDPADVVVCARPPRDFRLPRLSDRFDADAAALPRAETTVLGNAKLWAETEAADVGGFVSNRAMIRLKMPF